MLALTYPVCSGLLCLGVKERPGKGVQSESGKPKLGQDSSGAWVVVLGSAKPKCHFPMLQTPLTLPQAKA